MIIVNPMLIGYALVTAVVVIDTVKWKNHHHYHQYQHLEGGEMRGQSGARGGTTLTSNNIQGWSIRNDYTGGIDKKIRVSEIHS